MPIKVTDIQMDLVNTLEKLFSLHRINAPSFKLAISENKDADFELKFPAVTPTNNIKILYNF